MRAAHKTLPSSSHPVVSRAAATLGTDPVDVLGVILDVAGLAVDAVGGVDDEPHVALVIRLVLVNTSRAEPEFLNKIKYKDRMFRILLTFPPARRTWRS